MIMDFRIERKWSVVGFCTGAIAGLVAITPAAGFVGAPVCRIVLRENPMLIRFRPLL